jgi:serine/threonine-protein kinase
MRDGTPATVVQRRTPPGPEPAADARADPGSAASTPISTRKFTYSTPAETMRAEEMLRTRVFFRVVLLLIVAVGAVLPIMGGDPVYKWIFAVGLALAGVSSAVFLWFIRDEANYTPARAIAPIACCVVCVIGACNYFGIYSPAPMVLTFGIYFMSLGSSMSAAVWTYIAAVLLHGVGSVAVALGVLPDRGLIHLGDLDMLDRLIMITAGQAVLLVTFLMGRLSRRATLTAMERLEKAMRQVGQREALLQEANRDLERALRGGYRGRYTGDKVGAWQLSDVIGRGAMGEVYIGQHAQHGTPAAVKLLHPQVEADPEQLARFLREAEVMSKLDTPHIAKVHEVSRGGQSAPSYIAMELLNGHDLAWHLRKQRKMPPARVAELVTQVASALEVARAHDIVHRDLKPQNLFLAELDAGREAWKVLDFGVSKLGTASGTLTRGHVLGTPGYMAPEQARGLAVDHRADVFALAIIAYRALTGRPAFTGDDYPKVMFDLVYMQPARPTELATLPIDVDFALALGMAKKVKERAPTAVAFAEALAQAIRGELPPALAQRGQQLIMAHPWGKKAEGD